MNETEVTIEPPSRKPRRRAQEGEVTGIEMTKTCARDLTDRIKKAAGDLADMLHRAHEERAWAALGYESWKSYCTTEFQMSEQHSYRLLDFVQVRDAIVATHQLVSPQSESQVRVLVKLEPAQQSEAWVRAVQIADGEQPTAKQVAQAAEVSPKKTSPKNRLNDSRMRMMRELIDDEIAIGMTTAWEVLKKCNAAIEWTHFLAGVRRWLDRSQMEEPIE